MLIRPKCGKCGRGFLMLSRVRVRDSEEYMGLVAVVMKCQHCEQKSVITITHLDLTQELDVHFLNPPEGDKGE